MSKQASNSWRLNPQEVTWGMNNSSSGKSGQFDRKLKVTSSTMFLLHKPTDVKVEGEIPAGNYSKKEMQKQRISLEKKLFLNLEKLVAKKLKIKGR